ncbi:MAG: type VI secretion system baseplate subunit TssK [Planctomycetes bacterium]|nr:type VI secretion system baseplate subunit TssK [Planctomycetota bacterium]
MTARRSASVLWREGMFLCPQHMQAFTREVQSRIAVGDAIGQPGDFGVLSLAIDTDSLVRDVFRIDELLLVLRDGTLLSVPHNGKVPQREFAEFFTGAELTVYLGVPAAEENVPQLGDDPGRIFRHSARLVEVFDENVRDAKRELEFRQLNGHLFFGDEDRSGYDCLPIARLIRTGKPEAQSKLSPDWIAPVLRCGAVPAMVRGLQDIAERARAQARDLAATLPDFTRLSSVDSASDLTGIMKLQAVNRSLAVLEQLSRTADIHPFFAYVELARVVGELAIFSADRVMPELPAYRHAELDECFRKVLEEIRALLGAQVAVPYDVVQFEADADQDGIFYAPLPEDWLSRNPLFYLGVVMDQTQDKAAELVLAGVKLLAPDDLDRVLQGVLPGVGLEPLRLAPTSFPKRPNLHFFRISTEGESRDYWLNVVRARKAMVLSALGELGKISYGIYVELRS